MLLKLCKFSISMLFINLYVVYTLTGSYIPNGTLIFGFSSGLFMIMDVLNSQDRTCWQDIKPEMYTLIGFAIWIFMITPIALNPASSLNGAIEFLQRLVFVFVVYYICRKDGSLKFIATLFFFISVISALVLISMNGIVSSRLSLSENITINATGNLMVVGVFCAMYLYKGNKWYSFSSLVGLISLFMFVIALTGSRKSFFAVIILVALYVISMPKKPLSIDAKSVLSFIVLMVLVYILFTKVAPLISDTSLYARLFDERLAKRANESNEGRILFYRYAWNDFISRPIWGLGIRGYQAKHGSYTHSAYMEVLACTGVIGTLLYFTSYVRCLVRICGTLKNKAQGFFELRKNRLIFCFFIVFLYIGLGIGHLYDNLSMMELGIFMSAGWSLSKEKSESDRREGAMTTHAG